MNKLNKFTATGLKDLFLRKARRLFWVISFAAIPQPLQECADWGKKITNFLLKETSSKIKLSYEQNLIGSLFIKEKKHIKTKMYQSKSTLTSY